MLAKSLRRELKKKRLAKGARKLGLAEKAEARAARKLASSERRFRLLRELKVLVAAAGAKAAAAAAESQRCKAVQAAHEQDVAGLQAALETQLRVVTDICVGGLRRQAGHRHGDAGAMQA